DKFDECLRICLPIFRKAFEIFENCVYTRTAENCDSVFGILIKGRIEDSLIHEVRLTVNWEEYPAEIVQLERSEDVGISGDRRLDSLRVLMKSSFATRDDFRHDREAITRR